MRFNYHSFLRILIFTFSISFSLQTAHAQTGMNNSYDKKSFKNKTISMFYIPSARVNVFNINNAKDMFSSYKGEDKYIYSYNLYDAFLRNMKLNLKGIKYINHDPNNIKDIDFTDRAKFVERNIEVGYEKVMMSFNIPNKETIEALGFKADVICIVNEISINNSDPIKGTVTHAIGRTASSSMGIPGNLNSKLKYIIWDYSQNKPVSYGRLKANTVYTVELSRNVMLDHFNKVINKIYKSSPIKYKRSF